MTPRLARLLSCAITAILLAATLNLSAQTPDATADKAARSVDLIDPAAFGFGRSGYMVDATFNGTQDFANRPGGLDFSEVRTILPVWSEKVGDLRIGVSLSYNLSELDFNGFAGLQSESLHTLEAQIGLFWRPENSRWWGLGFVTPGIGTDFQGLSWDDFEISGLGLLGYRFTDTFSLAGGTFVQYGAQEGMIVPALGFIWQPAPFIIQVTPPFVVLGWRATDRVTLSLSAYPGGGSWDVEDPNVNRVDLSGWQAATSVMYQATERVSISLRAGLNIGGELELRDSSNRVLANETLESAPFGAVNVRWQF
ncbi:MAG: DUF6268 family outer membrane beta-barrel protein [Prosthecobacter sp.]